MRIQPTTRSLASARRPRTLQRTLFPLVLLAASAACNDLTAPLPSIAGTYRYSSSSELYASLNRSGTLTIVDLDPRTARFEGDFSYVAADGREVSGQLTGAFVRPDRIYFRFLTDRFQFHEADFSAGVAEGEIFLQSLTYFSTGSTFTLRPALALDRAGVQPLRVRPVERAAPE